MTNTRNNFKTATGLLGCKLCWKVASSVFLLILAIESIILVPSAQRFEANLLEQHANHAIIAIEPTLAGAGYGERAEALAQGLRNAVGMYGITGVLVNGPSGQRLASAGEIDGLDRQFALASPLADRPTRSADATRLDLAWPSERGVTVAARVDTSKVSGDVTAYTLRIVALVAIIVLVVTAGTMVVLNHMVLRPVLLLRASARAAACAPDQADRHVVCSRGHDEISELVAAHNSLLEQVAASKRRDHALAEERARHISNHDSLTGLPNRGALLQHLRRLGAAPVVGPSSVSLYLVNLLQFRILNLSFGAARCDALLREFATRLAQSVRPGDFLAHMGGDRFAVARANGAFEPAAAAEFAERLVAHVSHGYDLGDGNVSLSMRIGISSAGNGQAEAEVLIGQAELALARAMAEDGAPYEFYLPSFTEEAKARQALKRDLERGIDAQEFFVVLQPKVTLDPSGGTSLAGAEVLVRWRHPTRGVVGPSEFIALAESSCLIVPLGEHVLALACALLREWLDRHGWAPRLAVNISARQFALPDLELRLQRALALAGVTPDRLEIEVTESAAMKNAQQTASTLTNLRKLGVKVSIDDFGTGYSSLNYLRRFAVDAIKIDKSFVDDIGADCHAEAICEAVLRLGQALGCKVVAEGVETAAQQEFLRTRGCDEAQGYLYAQPLSAQQFEAAWIAPARLSRPPPAVPSDGRSPLAALRPRSMVVAG